MAVPTYDEMMKPVLAYLEDRKVRSRSDIIEYCADYYHLTEEERNECFASGKLMLHSRVDWAVTYLSKAELLERVTRGRYRITDEGIKVSQSNCDLNELYLTDHYPSFKDFKNR